MTKNKAASLTYYKGTRGRPAVVRDLETRSFLRANFDFDGLTRTGLRFLCSARKLVWVDGSVQKRAEFKAWARQWYRNLRIRCRKQNRLDFIPVYYLPDTEGFRWQADDLQKEGFNVYLVEFPTGTP